MFPYFTHSVVVPAAFEEMEGEDATLQRIIVGADSTVVNQEAGKAEVYIFANRGVTYVGSSEEWCRLLGEPGEYTVDTLDVEYDALPEGIERREAVITVTDGVTTLPLRLIQEYVEIPEQPVPTTIDRLGDAVVQRPIETVYDLQGRKMDNSHNKKGVYILENNERKRKVSVR